MNFFRALVLCLGLSASGLSLASPAVEARIVNKLEFKDFKKPQELADFVNSNNIAIVRVESFANRRFKFQRLWFERLQLKGAAADLIDFIEK